MKFLIIFTTGSILVCAKSVSGFLLVPSLASSRISVSSRLSSSSNPLQNFAPFGTKEASSRLISELAIIALKRRLAQHTSVRCDLHADPRELVQRGRIGPVSVKGRGWQSGLGLSCRAIEASVESCELDARRIASDRKIVLTRPARGKAMVALNSEDFGKFITHPLLKPPNSESLQNRLSFVGKGATVDSRNGFVSFLVQLDGEQVECLLRRGEVDGEQNAVISIPSLNGREDQSDSLREVLNDFFNKLTFELDGTYLSFRDLMIIEKECPLLMLSLDIVVEKFPSPGLAF